MQLSRKAFVGAVVATLAVGIAVGAFATSRTASDRRSLMLAQALPPVQAPILPVQMPLTTGTFAKVAEAIKPAVINVNIVMRGGAGGPAGRTPTEEFFGADFFRRFFGRAGPASAQPRLRRHHRSFGHRLDQRPRGREGHRYRGHHAGWWQAQGQGHRE
jgi:hypothetical protein